MLRRQDVSCCCQHQGVHVRHQDACAPALQCLAAAAPCPADGMSAIAAGIEGYIRATKESSGEVVTVLKQGYLLKRSSGMRREWKRRFFVLDSLGCLYYYSNKVTGGGLLFPVWQRATSGTAG